jgi:Leucine-rich repeat (LRR) protein/tRNA A-37 threonylcarbamoyl transferase component Bud32
VTDTDEEVLADLLLRWEELREQGQETPAAELCLHCPQLAAELARRIEALKVTSWMDQPLESVDKPTGEMPSTPSEPRTLIGRYRLDALIAEGGFAQVWRGYDLELQRVVAVKVPKPSRLQSVDAFMAEARRVARLKHPGIVPVHDVGREGESCFIVSEFVEGGSLGDHLVNSPPTKQQAIRWIIEVADALEYAHLHGVIHRDVKPANILIDHHNRALLADFGIAQSANKAGQQALSLGTLRYMSPEQLEGKPVDPRADIFSLGVVLHEALTGKLPYSSFEPNVLRREIVAGTATCSDQLPIELRQICEKAFHRHADQRYSSAAHFAAVLRKALESQPTKLPGKAFAWALMILVVTICAALLWWRTNTPVLSHRIESPVTKADFQKWSNEVGQLPAKAQIEAVRKELEALNPGFNGIVESQISDGAVVYLQISRAKDLTDISPVSALRSLKKIGFHDCFNLNDISPLQAVATLENVELFQTRVSDLAPLRGKQLSSFVCCYCPVTDLNPLKGMPLTHLKISRSQIADISPLRGMPLRQLDCHASQITDFAVLKELPLEILDVSYNRLSDLTLVANKTLRELNFHDTQVSSLAPLRGLSLTTLYCYGTAISDLSPLAEMKLTTLWCHNTKVSDFTAIKNMPLKDLRLDFKPERDTELLQAIKTLQTINERPALIWWKER